MNRFEQKLLDLTCKKDMEKVKGLKSMGRTILQSLLRRIPQNDRTVLKELVLPEWVSWELLRDWADTQSLKKTGRVCIFCGESNDVGMEFMEKFVCENCFLRLKHLR